MRLTSRDYELLETLYHYDGILSVDQVHRWFFGVKRRAYYRIRALCQHGFLQRLPVQELYRVPEPILWMDKMGAQALANYLGVEYSDLSWRNQPRWSKVSHDLALNEFRHRFETALAQHPVYALETWYGQDQLEGLLPDPIPYLTIEGESASKRIRPDGYVSLRVQVQPPYLLRFCIELDNNSESSRRFGRDKVAPAIHFLRSRLYQEVVGGKTGRFLVITVGPLARFHHLRAEVTQCGGAGYFLFSRSEAWASATDVLREPLLYTPHQAEPFSFETYHSEAFQARLAQSLAATPRFKTLY